MFDEPNELPPENALTPEQQAQEKADEFRIHAQLAAVFEGTRKFEAQIIPTLDPDLAREIQRTVGRLEKAKSPDSPVLPENVTSDAIALLNLPQTRDISTNDYHIHRRPGEVMIVRWLEEEQVESFYQRLQAHFDAAMEGFREDERSHEWKQDPKTLAFLDALEKLEIKMADRYLRDILRSHRLFVLSTQSADEMNIQYIADHIMGATAADLVGESSAPADGASESELAWFFKLFALRGTVDGVERMCFFTYMQKSDEGW